MRKARLTIIGLISVFVIALLAVNVVSIEKANERHFSEYCSELTRALVKAPLSYKLNDYTVRVSPMTKDELEEVVQMAPFNNIDDAIANDKYDRSKVRVYESFTSKNEMGVDLAGDALCVFNRISIKDISSHDSLDEISIDNESIDIIRLINAEDRTKKKIGDINEASDYMKKLKYILN